MAADINAIAIVINGAGNTANAICGFKNQRRDARLTGQHFIGGSQTSGTCANNNCNLIHTTSPFNNTRLAKKHKSPAQAEIPQQNHGCHQNLGHLGMK
jgi:hypothetical protein